MRLARSTAGPSTDLSGDNSTDLSMVLRKNSTITAGPVAIRKLSLSIPSPRTAL